MYQSARASRAVYTSTCVLKEYLREYIMMKSGLASEGGGDNEAI